MLEDSRYIEIDVCPSCRGAWFEQGELDRADDSIWVNVERLETTEIEAEKKYSCPACGSEMTGILLLNNVAPELEKCENCMGYWLDYGELEKIREIADHIDSVASEPSDIRMRKYRAAKNSMPNRELALDAMAVAKRSPEAIKFLNSIYKKQAGQL